VNCIFSRSLSSGKRVVLDGIKTICTSMGARAVEQTLLDLCQERKVISRVVTDQMALEACLQFAEDEQLLIEPACGAVLSSIYNDKIVGAFVGLPEGPVVIVVCGGNMASFSLFEEWKRQLGIPS